MRMRMWRGMAAEALERLGGLHAVSGGGGDECGLVGRDICARARYPTPPLPL